jgi:antitoxin component of RelBE/YafQ-DinJ toxin-antitoxin module
MPKSKAIYLGSQISDAHKLELVKVAKYKNIPIFQMEIDNNKFKLNIKTLEENKF